MFERLANRRIQKLLLGRVKTSELTAGSRSAQETDDEARKDRVMSYLGLMTKAIQHAIDALIAVNQAWGLPITAPQGIWFEYPKVKAFNVEEADRDIKYTSTGQVRLTKQRLLNVGYEESEFEMVEPAVPAPITQLSQQVRALQLQLSNGLPDNITEPTTDNDIEHDIAIMQPKVEALLSLLDGCESYSEFERRLSELSLPDGGMIEDLMTQCVGSYIDGLANDNGATD